MRRTRILIILFALGALNLLSQETLAIKKSADATDAPADQVGSDSLSDLTTSPDPSTLPPGLTDPFDIAGPPTLDGEVQELLSEIQIEPGPVTIPPGWSGEFFPPPQTEAQKWESRIRYIYQTVLTEEELNLLSPRQLGTRIDYLYDRLEAEERALETARETLEEIRDEAEADIEDARATLRVLVQSDTVLGSVGGAAASDSDKRIKAAEARIRWAESDVRMIQERIDFIEEQIDQAETHQETIFD